MSIMLYEVIRTVDMFMGHSSLQVWGHEADQQKTYAQWCIELGQ